MPRRTADRPICDPAFAEASAGGEIALQAAMRRALQQAAAPAVIVVTVPDPPAFRTAVAPTAKIRGAAGVARSRLARAMPLFRRTRKKESAPPERAADPRGRGGKVDLRV